ncbi:MAG TPA: hypothetical protein VHM26_01260 [Chitinophagaceae bacterium]|nr:hypothetical protein [Chitinophagaceae bacterium]
MKKMLIAMFIVMGTLSTAHAQLDFSQLRIDIAGNYTMYKGDFGESTPGAKLRLSLPMNEKVALGIGFTYGFPIKVPSEVAHTGGGTTASEIAFKFKTITLEGDYYFGEEKEEGLNVYASGRIGFVLVSYKENLKGTIPAGEEPLYMVEKTNESGFTINGALGLQYSLGNAKIFGDAGFALPANQVNGQYVENVIPAHLMFNVGLRFSLGGGGEY